ncbi:MAG: hypothetical protein ACI4MN_06300 [Candidatus Coproplasma sp.]
MKAKAFKIFNLILAILVFVFALSQTFAWFAEDIRRSDDKFDGSSSSPYFAGGTGTEDDPFTLTSPNHLYNLAWLQNTGNLNDQYYYFRLDADIDMSDYWLPPIGTDDYPFQGYFNGNGKKISNLKITTDSSKLTGAVSGSSVKYSHAVGMFGMTAAHVGVTDSKIYNFNLINPIVEVASQNATYNSASSEKKSVGIAIGYANCGAKNIGVLNGKLAVQNTNYTSKNSIVGDYDPTKVNGDKIDPTERGNISYFIPSIFSSNNAALAAGQWLVSDYGYDIGTTGENRWGETPNITSSTLGLANFSLVSAVDGGLQIRTGNGIEQFNLKNYTYGNNEPYSSGVIINYSTVDTDGKNWGGWILNKDGTAITDEQLNSSFRYLQVGVALGSSSLSIVSEDNASTIAVSNINSEGDYATLLANAFYFNITEDEASLFLAGVGTSGNIKIGKVMDRDNLTLLMKKKAAGELGIDIDGLSDSEIMSLASLSDYSCYDFFFRNDYDIFKGLSISITEVYNVAFEAREKINNKQTGVGYNFDLSNSPGLYVLYSDTKNADVHYLRATGVSYGEAGFSGSEVTDPKLENIDFIYVDSSSNVVLISDESLVATNVIVKFSTTDITYLYFYRPSTGKDSNGYTLDVEYSGTAPSAKTSSGGSCAISPQAWSDFDTFIGYSHTS